jgi:DNA adenine methylase
MRRLIIPPLKCQGIKSKLVSWILELAGTQYERWMEPFMGSGVVSFNAYPKSAVLADSNPHIIRFYQDMQSGKICASTVKQYLEVEGELLKYASEDGYVHYRQVRDRFNKIFDPLDFLFLSRAGFNGMMRFSKAGKWNIPFCKKPNRFAQAYITKIVNQVDACAKRICPEWIFVRQDFRITIADARPGDLIYCDPPYLGRYTDYYNNWSEDDERDLASLLQKTKARFILSSWHHNYYRQNQMLEKYWSNFNIITKDHFYHSGAKEENRNPIVEALVFNFRQDSMVSHNHGLKTKPEQLTLFENATPYPN